MYSLNRTPLKFYSRLGIYKNSAGTNVFNPKEPSAYSYGWWKYFARIDGKNVFNGYSYSVTTSKHQNRMLRLFEQLGVKIDLYIEAPEGLDNLQNALEYNVAKAFKAAQKMRGARKAHTKDAAERDWINANIACQFLTEQLKSKSRVAFTQV